MPPETPTNDVADRLDSWKDIAAYLRRDVSTVQRWEKREGLPVHRHQHDKLGSVYAFKSELDAWWEQGSKRLQTAPLSTEALPDSRKHTQSPQFPAPQRRVVVIGVAAILIVAAAFAWLATRRGQTVPQVARSVIPLPPGAVSAYALAVSPDGSHLAYVGVPPLGRGVPTGQLYLKATNELSSVLIGGTEGATRPFFSPDGKWIAFFARNQLKKVAVSGGAPIVLCDVPQNRGGTWGPDNTIVFSRTHLTGLWRVSAHGGEPVPITTPDRRQLERSHREPHFLPGGRALLFTVHKANHSSMEDSDIEALVLATGERHVLVRGGMGPQYLPSGHLIYGRAGALHAAPFDVNRLVTTGPPVRVIDAVLSAPEIGRVAYGVSATGTLIYAPGGSSLARRNLAWVDRTGKAEPLNIPPKTYMYPRVAPDGGHVVVSADTGRPQLWIFDLSRGTLTLRSLDWDAEEPSWTPDGSRLTFGWTHFAPDGTSLASIYTQPVDGSIPPQPLVPPPLTDFFPYDWSPDGRLFAYGKLTTHYDILAISSEARTTRPIIATPANETAARFSPDGRWLAYVSDESGRNEVYVGLLSNAGDKKQISIDGGIEPVWARDGRELFFRGSDHLMAVSIGGTSPLTVSRPRRLFPDTYSRFLGPIAQYDVAPNGRFLMTVPTEEAALPAHLVVVQNWSQELERLAPRE